MVSGGVGSESRNRADAVGVSTNAMLEVHKFGPDVPSEHKRHVWLRVVGFGLLGAFWLSVNMLLALADEKNEPTAGFYVFVFGGYVGITALAYRSLRRAEHQPKRAFFEALAINPATYLLGGIAVIDILR